MLRHHSLRLASIAQTISRPTPLTSLLTTTPRRAYASKKQKQKTKPTAKHGDRGHDDTESPPLPASKRAPIATALLTPGSQRTLVGAAARDELARADAKMAASVAWLRRGVAQLEARASGRVTPQLLAPVRVTLESSSGARKAQLEEVATVGVRDGSSLIVIVFDPQVSCCVPVSFQFFSPNVSVV
jgi:ribosome recycling factor